MYVAQNIMSDWININEHRVCGLVRKTVFIFYCCSIKPENHAVVQPVILMISFSLNCLHNFNNARPEYSKKSIDQIFFT